ncbi:MAG TPA: RNA methyltransferase [Candidatus Kapabacteria bacterium]|nr:RNA methyltransferase [Candidatus Kapabacteria bacterium]
MQREELSEARYTRLRALLQKKMREKYGEFIVEGKRLVAEALHSGWKVHFVCVQEERVDQLPFLSSQTVPVYTLPEDKFAEISATEHSQGVIAVLDAKNEPLKIPTKEKSIVLALDSIADPGNVGTIIRSADWFGVDAVLLGKGCAELYNPKTVRSTMGSIFRVPTEESNLFTTLPEYRKQGYQVYATTTSDTLLDRKFSFAPKSLLLIGSEAEGISHELLALADHKVTIKKYGGGESLNAAMATAVALAMMRNGE